jgi:hypothetical protein
MTTEKSCLCPYASTSEAFPEFHFSLDRSYAPSGGKTKLNIHIIININYFRINQESKKIDIGKATLMILPLFRNFIFRESGHDLSSE